MATCAVCEEEIGHGGSGLCDYCETVYKICPHCLGPFLLEVCKFIHAKKCFDLLFRPFKPTAQFVAKRTLTVWLVVKSMKKIKRRNTKYLIMWRPKSSNVLVGK
jgi:hypothetical protein